MLRKAQERVAELGLNNVEGLWVMDAENLSFPDNSFDVVVAQYVVTTVPNPEATLDEFARVLKPGGEIILVSRVGAEAGSAALDRAWLQPAARKLGWRTEFSVRALFALGRAHHRHGLGRAPRHAAVRALLADPLRARTAEPSVEPRRTSADDQPRGARGVAEPRRRLSRSARSASAPSAICCLSQRIHRIAIARSNDLMTGRIRWKNFATALRIQRWDDHRYYHHSRINQIAALRQRGQLPVRLCDDFQGSGDRRRWSAGWSSMTTRQAGHFFFEPKDYDAVNHATHEYKEEIKVGYNLRRKVVLMTIWALSPLRALFRPDPVRPVHARGRQRPISCARSPMIWLAIGIGGLLFRTVQLFFIQDVQTGLVWATKILTDPFHDIKLYHKAPLALLRGELIDPGIDLQSSMGRGRRRRSART